MSTCTSTTSTGRRLRRCCATSSSGGDAPTRNLDLGAIGIGTLAWGDAERGFGTKFREKDCAAAFEAAADGGVTFFDTAEVYGYKSKLTEQTSEEILGRLAREREERLGEEGKVLIGSKVFTIPWTNVIMKDGGLRTGSKQLVAALEKSVERVGRPLDVWSIHFPFPSFSQATLSDALKEGADRGLCKSVGVSNYSKEQMEEMATLLEPSGLKLVSNQVEYNLLNRKPEKDGTIALAESLGVTIVAHTPLACGKLTTRNLEAAGGDDKLRQILKICEFVGALSGSALNVQQVAMAYLVTKGAVPIPGCSTVEQAAAVAAAGKVLLDENEVGVIDEKLDYLSL